MIEDGIYMALEAAKYHADPALGSGDVRRLARNPTSYWWTSAMNPNKPKDKDTPARIRGRAMHEFVLESEALFKGNYMRGPYTDEDDYTTAEKTALTKDAKKKAAEAHKVLIKADDYDRIIIASAMITKNPELKTVFAGGYPEVSVFWTHDGVRRKCRLDYLKTGGIGDLKSITNMMDLPFDECCLMAFKRQRMDVQAYHYFQGRAAMRALFEKRKCPDADSRATLFLETVVKQTDIGFQWVFFQSDDAPITFSKAIRPNNPMLRDHAKPTLDRAIDNYKKYMKEFGTGQPWLLMDPTTEITVDDFLYGFKTSW